jgi:hypothetical protein
MEQASPTNTHSSITEADEAGMNACLNLTPRTEELRTTNYLPYYIGALNNVKEV